MKFLQVYSNNLMKNAIFFDKYKYINLNEIRREWKFFTKVRQKFSVLANLGEIKYNPLILTER